MNVGMIPEKEYAEMIIAVFEQMLVHSCDAELMTDGVMTGGRRLEF